MAKFNQNKRIKKDLKKNNKNQKKLNFKNTKIKSSKSKTISIKKRFKKFIKIKKVSNRLIYNNENKLYNNILTYPVSYNNEKNDIFYVMRCYDCSFIPLIKIKYSQINIIQNKEIFSENYDKYAMVQLYCCKGHSITTKLKQYLINCKINHNFLSLCGECHESKSNEFFNFSYCKKCKKTLCSKCAENHKDSNKNINNLNNLENYPQEDENILNLNNNKNKNLISLYEIDFYCIIHKKEFCSFCKDCNSNLCSECQNYHNILHKIIIFDKIKLNEEEIQNIEYNIDLAKKRISLFDIKILSFIQSLFQLEKIHQQLLNLYTFFIEIYKEQIFFSEIILSIYKDSASINKYNFQIIQNLRNLKFNIRGIPIKNSYDFSTNIKSLTSYLTNSKNFLLLDIKNYYSNKKIIKARIRAAAKRIRNKIHLNNLKIKKNEEKKQNNIDNPKEHTQNIGNINSDIGNNIKDNEINNNLINNEKKKQKTKNIIYSYINFKNI